MNVARDRRTEAAGERLLSAGLDLLQPFDVARYNRCVADHDTLRPLPVFGRDRALGLLIGNTRALWPHFVEAFRETPALRESSDPLDRFVADAVNACADEMSDRTSVHLGSDGGERLVSMLHLARVSGLAHVGPAHLAVHPIHGTWFAVRALVIVDADPGEGEVRVAHDSCARCEGPCVSMLEKAVSQTQTLSRSGIGASWESWLAVRDACPVGRASRYGDAQIRYHYAGDESGLA